MRNDPFARLDYQGAIKKLASARLNSLRDMQAGKYPYGDYRKHLEERLRPFYIYDAYPGVGSFARINLFPMEYFEFADDASTILHIKGYVYEMHLCRDYYILETWGMRYLERGTNNPFYRNIRSAINNLTHRINMFEARLQKLGHPTARQQRLETLKRERLGTQA